MFDFMIGALMAEIFALAALLLILGVGLAFLAMWIF